MMKELVLKVQGMMCASCENRVQLALMEINGIEKVKADHNHDSVTITLKNDVDLGKIKERIEDLGYTVID